MPLINCQHCGRSISDVAKKCPNCGRKVRKIKNLPFILIMVFVFFCVGGCLVWNQYQKNQEEKRQEQIKDYLAQINELYMKCDFDGIKKCLDSLNELNYDVSKQRKILEYDRIVNEDAYSYYATINDVNDKLHSGGYRSLRALIDKMKNPTEKFESLEINTDSEIGKYINNVKNNIMFNIFNSEFVYGNKYDLDYGLTSWGYAYVIETYTEEIVKERFPYVQTQN